MDVSNLDVLIAVLGVMTAWSGLSFYRFFVRPRFKGWQGEKRLRDLLELFEYEAVHNIYVPNAEGKLAQIDHIVKFRNTLGVIETKNYSGEIDAVAYAKNWIQTINGRDYPIPNPLNQVKRQVDHLQSMLPDTKIRGTVVYAGDAKFTDETPEDVFTFEEFRSEISKYKKRKHLHDHSHEFNTVWLEVIDQANQTSGEKRRKHLIDIGAKQRRNWRKDAVAAQFALLASSVIGLVLYRLSL